MSDPLQKNYGFDLYTSNPEHVACCILHGKSKQHKDIQGRAMVFFDKNGKGYMNKPYVSRDMVRVMLNDYAKSQGWALAGGWGKDVIIPMPRQVLYPLPSTDGLSIYNGLCMAYNIQGTGVINGLIKEIYGIDDKGLPVVHSEAVPVDFAALGVKV